MSVINTNDVSTLLPNMRAYLTTLGLVKTPGVVGDAPPMWLDPSKGVPYPGQTKDLGPNESHPTLVLGAYPATGIPSRPFEGFYRQKGVSIYIRGSKSPFVQKIYERGLLPALHDVRDISMNGLLVNQSMCSRDLARVGADENGYVYACEFMMDMFSPESSTYG
jgi:hypothetical protein